MSLTLPIRDVIHSWAGDRALPSSPFETLALSSAAELVGVAQPRCGGSITRESDISNGENGDISIGRLQAACVQPSDRNVTILPICNFGQRGAYTAHRACRLHRCSKSKQFS